MTQFEEIKRESKGIRIAYTAEQFKNFGFDGEIGTFMRTHRNSAIVNSKKIGGHIVEYDTYAALQKYREEHSDM